MIKFFKRTLISLVLLAALYSGIWFFAAYKINEGITQFYTIDGPASGYTFYGDKPTLSGFPLMPTVAYEKGFENNDIMVTFERVVLQGFPLPTRPMTLRSNGDVIIQDKRSGQKIELDYLLTEIITPKALPASNRKADITTWQKNVGSITVDNFQTAANGMTITSRGPIGLDNALQPSMIQDAVISGHETLIEYFVETGELKPLPAALALSALNAMVEVNPQTNQREVNLQIRLQNRTLFLGPVRVMSVPNVNWR